MKTLKIAIALLLFAGLASAAPCTLGVAVQPEFPVAGQQVSISYTAPYLGFIQTPSISIDGNQITIDQPTVHADPIALGDVPCGQRLVQAGTFQPGSYSIAIHLSTAAPMSGSFVVRPSTVTPCGMVQYAPMTGPAGGTHSVSIKALGGSLSLHFENRDFLEYVGVGSFQAPLLGVPEVGMAGSQIQVTQTYMPFMPFLPSESGPGLYARFCQSEDIDLGALGTGSFNLVWTYLTPSGSVSVSSSFSNGSSAPSRGRAVRGH